MIRILYVTTTLGIGGAERSLLELVRRLDRKRFEPIVCSLTSGARLASLFTEENIALIEINVGAGMTKLNALRLLGAMTRVRPDVIQTRLIRANMWGRLGRLLGIPVICEERGLARDRSTATTLANRWSQALVTITVANSDSVAAHVRDRDRTDDVRVIRGGVDTHAFAPASTQPRFDFVSVTRLEPYKGTADLVDAMALVRARRPTARLLIVGDGSERSAVAARAAPLGDAIEFAGEDLEVAARLADGRVFVLSSWEEGLPNAVMEAMACGLAVLATDVGGTPELVVPGVTGTLVPPHDPRALADAMLAYLDSPALAQAHGQAGRTRAVEELDIASTVAHYEALYESLARRTR